MVVIDTCTPRLTSYRTIPAPGNNELWVGLGIEEEEGEQERNREVEVRYFFCCKFCFAFFLLFVFFFSSFANFLPQNEFLVFLPFFLLLFLKNFSYQRFTSLQMCLTSSCF